MPTTAHRHDGPLEQALPADSVAPRARALVVDDTEANRELFAYWLESAGYDVELAVTGADGLATAAATIPDLVVLDVCLPDMSGFDVCKDLRSNRRTADIAILQTSAAAKQSRDRVTGLDAGADAYVTLPVPPIELVAVANALVRARRAEQGVRLGERRWETFLATTASGVAVATPEGKVERINPALAKLLSVSAHALQGESLRDLVREEDRTAFDEAMISLDADTCASIDLCLARRNGTAVPVHATWTAVHDDGERCSMIVMECHDLTERNRRLDELSRAHADNAIILANLRDANVEKAGLLRALVEAAENERRRLAAELHDGAVQQLAALGFRVERARRYVTTSTDRSIELLDELQDDLSSVTSMLRCLMSELRPPTLDELGLAGAVSDYVAKVAGSHALRSTCVVDLGPDRLPPDLETNIFRVVQEALTNVRKHARASDVWVELRREGGDVRLHISDNGRGFDATARPVGNSSGEHYGLVGMRDRVERLGGAWSITSTPINGTRVTAEFSLPAEPVS